MCFTENRVDQLSNVDRKYSRFRPEVPINYGAQGFPNYDPLKRTISLLVWIRNFRCSKMSLISVRFQIEFIFRLRQNVFFTVFKKVG